MVDNSMILLKSLIIGIFLYIIFSCFLKMDHVQAESLSIVIACASCIFLVVSKI